MLLERVILHSKVSVGLAVIILDLEQGRLFFDLDLNDGGESTHYKAMLFDTVSILLSKSTILLESRVQSLMPSACDALHPLVLVIKTSGCLGPNKAITIASIRDVHLSGVQRLLQTFVPGNLSIWIRATRIRTIAPNEISGLQADTKLIADTSAFELV